MRLGVLRRVLSHATGNHLWITALGAFDMRSTGDFLPEAQLWQTVAPTLQTTILDAGMPKEHAEVLVAGDVCARRAGPPAASSRSWNWVRSASVWPYSVSAGGGTVPTAR